MRSNFARLAMNRVAMTAMLGLTLIVVASCGTSTSTGAAIVNGKNCKHIGFLLPESATAARWEAADHPDVVKAIQKDLRAPRLTPRTRRGPQASRRRRAELTGACILIVAPVDSTAAAPSSTWPRRRTFRSSRMTA